MARLRKYLNLTDTDIDEVLYVFDIIIKLADAPEFIEYIDEYHSIDKEERGYDSTEIITFCNYIHDFVLKKRDKLRVKTDLKLNKDELFSLIFSDNDIKLDPRIRYWISVILQYNFSKYEIYDHIDQMEENYKAMYDQYLTDYDVNKMETSY